MSLTINLDNAGIKICDERISINVKQCVSGFIIFTIKISGNPKIYEVMTDKSMVKKQFRLMADFLEDK
jgi:hypothetical protein